MSRYTGSTYKKSRRYGFSTLQTGKELAKRPYAPGQHGNERRRKLQLQINHTSSLMENYARNFNKQNNPDEIIALIKSFVPEYNYFVKGIHGEEPKPVMIHFWI